MSEKIIEVDGKRYKKVQKGVYYDKNKRKWRRHHPVRNILIATAVVIIVAPVTTLFACFFVPKNNNLPDTYEKFETNLTNTLVKSLTGLTENKGKFIVDIDNNFMNSSLAYVKSKFLDSTPANNFVDNIYCTVDGNKYNFIVDAHASFFQTRVTLATSMTYNDSLFTFKIDDVLLGRLPLGNLASSILPQFIKEDDINKSLENAHFRAKLSLADRSITYPRNYFKEDIGEVLKSFYASGDNSNPLGSLSSLILSLYDAIKTDPSFSDGIKFGFDLSKIGGYVEYGTGETKPKIEPKDSLDIKYDDKLTEYKNFVIECLNEGIVSSKTILDKETQGADNLLKFLLDGYDKKYTLSDALKNKIKTKFGLSDINEYKGLFVDKKSTSEAKKYISGMTNDLVAELNNDSSAYHANSSIILNSDEAIKDAIAKLAATSGTEVVFGTLGADLLSAFLRYNILPSFVFCFPIKFGDTYVMPTITFKDFTCNIESIKDTTRFGDTQLQLIGDMSLEGCKVPFTVLCKVDASGRKINITPSKFYLGNVELQEVGDLIMSFVTATFSTDQNQLFSYDTTNKCFSINFASLKVSKSESISDEYLTKINEIVSGTGELGSKVNLKVEVVDPKAGTNKGQLKFSFVKQ